MQWGTARRAPTSRYAASVQKVGARRAVPSRTFCSRYTEKMRSAARLLLVPVLLCAQSDELALKSQRGKEAMAAGRFAEAATIYSELVRDLPDNPGLLMNLGLAQHMAGQYRKAIPPLDAAVKLEPKLLPAWLFLGASHLKLGQPAKAIAPLEKVLELDANQKDARGMLADALFSLDRLERAAAEYRKVSELELDNPKGWYGLGRSFDALSRRAFAEIEKAAPESEYWLALVAGTRVAKQQYSSAFFFYRQALEKQPKMRGIHGALADVYKRTGHPDWAATEEARERALGAPDCSQARIECDFARGRYREVVEAAKGQKSAAAYYFASLAYNELALEAFSRLAQLPSSAELHQLMAESHRNQGRHSEAVKEWRETLKLSPGDPGIERELAVSLHQSRDYEGAQALLQRLLERDPYSAEVNFLLGDSLLNSQQPEKAIPYLKKAALSDPKVLAAQASLGRAYIQAGQAAQAIPHLKAALPLDDDGSLHYQLARAHLAAGRQDLAKEALEKYQQILKATAEERQKLEKQLQITPP